jgi:single-stranded-DNA-specific exonuclease
MERYHRPSCAFGEPDDSGNRKGSLRTIERVHLGDFISSAKHLILGGGGHAKAAGCSIQEASIDAFRNHFTAQMRDQFAGGVPGPSSCYDVNATIDQLDLPFFQAIDVMAPFGQEANDVVVRLRAVHLSGDPIPLGKSGYVVKGFLADPATGGTIPYITMEAKRMTSEGLQGGMAVDVLAVPEINRWKGSEVPQLRIIAINHAAT